MAGNASTQSDSTGFAERLRLLRQQKGLSQTDLARKLDVQPNHIGRYERGESRPTAKSLKALAEVLEVSADYLFDGDEEGAAVADLKDRELLQLFTEIENFPQEDKDAIKNVIDAFIARQRVRQIASNQQAS